MRGVDPMSREYEADYGVAIKDEAFVRWREAEQQKTETVVKVPRGMQVTSAIEIGCGAGAVLKRLQELKFAKHFARVDVSHSAVTFMRNVCGNSMSNAGVASATALPFRNTAFDVAILSHIIEHLHEPAQALAEDSRIARYIVFEVPAEVVLSNAIRRNVLRKPYASIEAAGHVQFWSTKSIKRLLKRGRSLVILENHVDLISKEAEYFGKSGLGLTKPMLKQTLKALLPAAVYARVPTSHSTSLYKRAGT
jgi:ubiquinone/menaquinone biosynthesis C-methylase UbiE